MKTDLELALDQIAASRCKGIKSAAWACAEYAAELAGVSIVYPEDGNWPDLERLEKDVRANCNDRLTPHAADAACAQAGEVDGETRGAADV